MWNCWTFCPTRFSFLSSSLKNLLFSFYFVQVSVLLWTQLRQEPYQACVNINIPTNSWSCPHTCRVHTSGTAPRPTAEAKTARCQTSSGSGTQVRGRQLRSCSWRSRIRPGRTEEDPNRCPRSQRTVVLKAVGAGCSAPPRASQLGRQTAAV